MRRRPGLLLLALFVAVAIAIQGLEFGNADCYVSVDPTLMPMENQIIMMVAKIHGTTAHYQEEENPDLYALLVKCARENQAAIGESQMGMKPI